MTLDSFNEICSKLWEQEPRGDVRGLKLTSEDHIELISTCLEGSILAGNKGASVGVALTSLMNPVTRSVVTVSVGPVSEVLATYRV
jgi:hypothetical protein